VSSNPILRSVLLYGGAVAVVLAIVAGGVGFAVDGQRGLVSGLLGILIAAFFLGLTAGSILFANRFRESDVYIPLFFGVVMGGWIVKFILFFVIALILRDQEWVAPTILFVSLIVGTLATLVVDVIVIAKSRMPYASDVKLPEYRGSDD
jgi:uncharacterized membrane protein YhdT